MLNDENSPSPYAGDGANDAVGQGANPDSCLTCGSLEDLHAVTVGALCGGCAVALLRELQVIERGRRVARLREANQRRREEGPWFAGMAPYGYKYVGDGRMEPVPAHLAVCAWICQQRARGFAWRQITEALNAAGTPAPRGGSWNVTTVRRIALRGSEPPRAAVLAGVPLADVVAGAASSPDAGLSGVQSG